MFRTGLLLVTSGGCHYDTRKGIEFSFLPVSYGQSACHTSFGEPALALTTLTDLVVSCHNSLIVLLDILEN